MSPGSPASLSSQLLRELSAALPDIYGCTTRHALVQTVTQLLVKHIASECGSYAALEPANSSATFIDSAPEVTARIQKHLPALWAHQEENAYFQGRLDPLVGTVCATSDWISDRELERTGLYQEFLHPIGAQRQLVLLIDKDRDGTRISYGLQREGRDFSARERAVLEFLAPHLIAAHAQVIGRERSFQTWNRLTTAMARSPQGVVQLNADLHPLRWNEPAETWLAKVAPKQRWNSGLPKALRVWAPLAREQYRHAGRAVPWTNDQTETAFRAELLWEAVSGHSLLLLDMPAGKPAAKHSRAFGVTAREGEVLHWLSHGKTNAEIATILGISTSTVAKHVERLLSKLGVENRMAAAAMVWEKA